MKNHRNTKLPGGYDQQLETQLDFQKKATEKNEDKHI